MITDIERSQIGSLFASVILPPLNVRRQSGRSWKRACCCRCPLLDHTALPLSDTGE